MSHPADDIMIEVRQLLLKHLTKGTSWALLNDLEKIMQSNDRAEFVRLMQKWLASS